MRVEELVGRGRFAETERGLWLVEGCCGPLELMELDEADDLLAKEPCDLSSASDAFLVNGKLPDTVCLSVRGGLEVVRADARRLEGETLLLSVASTSFKETFVPGEAICHGEVGVVSCVAGATRGELLGEEGC
jgi:hypothetical protein